MEEKATRQGCEYLGGGPEAPPADKIFTKAGEGPNHIMLKRGRRCERPDESETACEALSIDRRHRSGVSHIVTASRCLATTESATAIVFRNSPVASNALLSTKRFADTHPYNLKISLHNLGIKTPWPPAHCFFNCVCYVPVSAMFLDLPRAEPGCPRCQP